MTENHQPTKGYRTFVLILLTIVYGFNFIDRQIVGILAPFIQADLNLTNTELGLLIGLAFAVFYTTVAIPIAWLACLLYTSPSPRDVEESRMPSSA